MDGHATFPGAEKGAYWVDASLQCCETVRNPWSVPADKENAHELNQKSVGLYGTSSVEGKSWVQNLLGAYVTYPKK